MKLNLNINVQPIEPGVRECEEQLIKDSIQASRWRPGMFALGKSRVEGESRSTLGLMEYRIGSQIIDQFDGWCPSEYFDWRDGTPEPK